MHPDSRLGFIVFLLRLSAARASPVIRNILEGYVVVVCMIVDGAADRRLHSYYPYPTPYVKALSLAGILTESALLPQD